jgi:hypothetical protein
LQAKAAEISIRAGERGHDAQLLQERKRVLRGRYMRVRYMRMHCLR